MMCPRVSIIIPVYNADRYLASCLDSVLNQTFQDYEVLLIDDGSTDESGRICDEYEKKDTRIRAFHKKNGGVSSARNLGLDHVSGEFFTFLDSDDELNADTLESVVQLTNAHPNVDLIDFPIFHYNSSGDDGKLVAVNEECMIRGDKEKTQYWFYYPRFESCGRLYRKDKAEGLRFNANLKVGEDTVFFMSYYMNCDECIATPNGRYNYLYRDGSAMNRMDDETWINNDLRMLKELEGSTVECHPVYGALMYRIILPKLREGHLRIGQIGRYRRYIRRIKLGSVISNGLPIKVVFVLAGIKFVSLFR